MNQLKNQELTQGQTAQTQVRSCLNTNLSKLKAQPVQINLLCQLVNAGQSNKHIGQLHMARQEIHNMNQNATAESLEIIQGQQLTNASFQHNMQQPATVKMYM